MESNFFMFWYYVGDGHRIGLRLQRQEWDIPSCCRLKPHRNCYNQSEANPVRLGRPQVTSLPISHRPAGSPWLWFGASSGGLRTHRESPPREFSLLYLWKLAVTSHHPEVWSRGEWEGCGEAVWLGLPLGQGQGLTFRLTYS